MTQTVINSSQKEGILDDTEYVLTNYSYSGFISNILILSTRVRSEKDYVVVLLIPWRFYHRENLINLGDEEKGIL